MYREIEKKKNTSKIIKQSLYERNTLSSHKKKNPELKKKFRQENTTSQKGKTNPEKSETQFSFFREPSPKKNATKITHAKKNNNDANNQASEAVEQSRAINHAGGQANRRARARQMTGREEVDQVGCRTLNIPYRLRALSTACCPCGMSVFMLRGVSLFM